MTPAFRLPWEWRLTVLSTSSVERPAPLPLQLYEAIEFGRAADYVIGDPELSRRHGRVTLLEGDDVLVEDLGSRNGTRVERRRLRSDAWSGGPDVVILAGQTVLHVGRALPAAVDPLELDDVALLYTAARVAAIDDAVLLTTTAPAFAERLARLTQASSVTVWSLGWNSDDEVAAAVERAPGGSWLVLTDPRHPNLGELLERASRRGLRVVILSERPTDVQVRAVGESRVVVLPAMGDRRDELYRRLRAGLARVGCHVPFRATALHRLLLVGWDERLFDLRLKRLALRWQATPTMRAVNSDDVRAALKVPGVGELPRRRHVVPVDIELVKQGLAEGLSVAELAQRHSRSRKQVYRWLEALGEAGSGTPAFRSTSEPTP